MMRPKRWSVLSVALVLSLAWVGCAREEPLVDTLNFALGLEPTTLDPALPTDVYSVWVIHELFPGLTDFDPQSGEVVPRLATGWDTTSDGLTWTFSLRDDVYWAHYDPQTSESVRERLLTAHDVAYAVRRFFDPATAAPMAYAAYAIKNAREINTAEIDDMDALGVQALDDHTVQFTLVEPAAYWPSLMAMIWFSPVPREAIEQHGPEWTEAGNTWTYGPYLLGEWKHDHRIELIQNPHYYDAKAVSIATINVLLAVDSSTLVTMYETGELDTTMVAPGELDRLRADPELSQQLQVVPVPTTNYVGFNLGKAPVDSALVRKALSAAIDREALVQNVLRGDEVPARTFTAPGVFGSPAGDPAFAGITFDPEQARQWLAEAGYPGGQGFPTLQLWFTHTAAGGNPFPKIAPFIQQQWGEHLGVEVKLASQEWKAYLQTINTDPPAVWSIGWNAVFPDAHCTLLWPFHPTEGMDKLRWDPADPAAQRYMELTEQAAAETDAEVRRALYFEAEQILCEEQAGVIPLYHETERWLTKPYVERTPRRLYLHLYRWKVRAH